MFQEYVSLKNRRAGNEAYTGDCKTQEICQLRTAQSQYHCATVSLGINFKRDAAGGGRFTTTAGECDGSRGDVSCHCCAVQRYHGLIRSHSV